MSDSAPSPSALMYVFSERLESAGSDDRTLAPLLLAVASWALREQGTIELSPLAHPRPVDGYVGFTRRRAYVEQPGLEGALLLSMTGKGKKTPGISILALLTIGLPIGFETEARPDSLRHSIETGPWQTRNPHRAVIEHCRREARRVGALRRIGGARLSGLEAPFGELRSRWQHFERREADLHASLMSECVAGLARLGH